MLLVKSFLNNKIFNKHFIKIFLVNTENLGSRSPRRENRYSNRGNYYQNNSFNSRSTVQRAISLFRNRKRKIEILSNFNHCEYMNKNKIQRLNELNHYLNCSYKDNKMYLF